MRGINGFATATMRGVAPTGLRGQWVALNRGFARCTPAYLLNAPNGAAWRCTRGYLLGAPNGATWYITRGYSLYAPNGAAALQSR